MNIETKIKSITLILVYTLIFFSCKLQEKSMKMFDVKDIETYKSTINSLYQQNKLIKEAKDALLSTYTSPELLYSLHILDKSIKIEYPGYVGNFNFICAHLLEELTNLTIELENGKGVTIYTNQHMNINTEYPIDEGLIKQIASVYGLIFIHNPQNIEDIKPIWLTILYALNIKAIKLGVQDLLKFENLILLLSIDELLEDSTNTIKSIIFENFENYNQLIIAINNIINSLSENQKIKIRRNIDLINNYRIQHNLPKAL